jgi:hypothetical protein
MAEVEKMRAQRQAEFALAKICEKIDGTIVNEIYPPITRIDSGDLD